MRLVLVRRREMKLLLERREMKLVFGAQGGYEFGFGAQGS